MRLALIGDPVAHSASPALQRRALADAGIAGDYITLRVVAGGGAAAIDALRARGYHGLNVTTPLKEEAFALAALRDPSAVASGSVNTLVLGTQIAGFNTDGAGALGALREAGLAELAMRRVLVLGTGPTARAASHAFAAAGARVSMWSRTPARARHVAQTLNASAFLADAGIAADAAFTAVFAALPPGARLDAAARAAVLAAPLFVDANYGERATLAADLGRRATDGLAMLRHSAAASFAIWRAAWVASGEIERAAYGEGEIRTPETF